MRNSLTGAVQTILAETLNAVLPKIARDSLGAHIREQVLVICQGALDRSIEISVAPQNESAVRSLLTDDLDEPFVLTTDPLLAPTQAVLRLGRDERELDLGRLVDGIGASISTFFETEKPEATHG